MTNNKLLMTAGPTMVSEDVRLARSTRTTNPDIDKDFSKFYDNLCKRISNLLDTKNETLILSGEGMLGLDASICSLTETNDRVLIISNGIFGEGFKDLVSLYGGIPVIFEGCKKNPVNLCDLKDFLEKDSDFKYATLVHCDTPSGILNPAENICNLLDEYGIISVVDAVSSFPAEPLSVDKGKIDVCLGASQKAYSAQTGLSIVTLSEKAIDSMKSRKTSISSFYCNLLLFKEYRDMDYFAYTMAISDIISLEKAIENIEKEGLENFQARHFENAEILRESIKELGLKTYLESGFSNTVTAIELPNHLTDDDFRSYIFDKFGILLSDSLLYLKGHIFRVGHMGENSKKEYLNLTINAIKDAVSYFEV